MNPEQLPRILVVEDDEGSGTSIRSTLLEAFEGKIDVRVEERFDNAADILHNVATVDAVILDLYVSEDPEGQGIWEQIWREGLIPVVIHTAREWEILVPPVPTDNPFICCIRKGSGSDLQVAQFLLSINPYIDALHEIRKEFQKAIHAVIEQTAPRIWPYLREGDITHPEVLVRCVRRRLAALMDLETILSQEKLLGWEQFIYPPLGDEPLTGDLLIDTMGDPKDPRAYRLVLTPSCDMQVNNGKRKVEHALVSRCIGIEEYLRIVQSIGKVKAKEMKENLPRFLSEPQIGGIIPIPKFAELSPLMATNIRDLELIPVSEISSRREDGIKFVRVVSTDSPFREQIIWAYVQIAGRPGLPERELDKWAGEIVAATTENSREQAEVTVQR